MVCCEDEMKKKARKAFPRCLVRITPSANDPSYGTEGWRQARWMVVAGKTEGALGDVQKQGRC